MFFITDMILERIKTYIDYKGITVSAFEKSIGMSNASFGKSLKNKGAIGTDKLENILKTYPDLSPIWLVSGVGEMLLDNMQQVAQNINSQNDGIEDKLLRIIQEKDNVIREQAEEIGQLRERIIQMERRRGKDASDAPTSGVANVG